MRLSVVIPAWNQRELLRRCLASVERVLAELDDHCTCQALDGGHRILDTELVALLGQLGIALGHRLVA